MLNHRNIFCLFSAGLILSVSWAANPEPVGYSSCVAYYKFTKDYNSNGIVELSEIPNTIATTRNITNVYNSPTWVAAPTTTYTGMTTDGNAISFNGTNQYLKTTMDTSFSTKMYSTGSVSLWARVKFDYGVYGWLDKLPIFSQFSWSVKGILFNLRAVDDYGWAQLNVQACSPTVNRSFSAGIVLCDEWADVGLSYNAATSTGILTFSQYGYWNSFEFDFQGFGSILNPTGINAYFAAGGDGTFFPGDIESMAFWNAALTEQDLKNMSFPETAFEPIPEPATIVLLTLGGLLISRKKTDR